MYLLQVAPYLIQHLNENGLDRENAVTTIINKRRKYGSDL
jgi:hypothetical protein